MHYIGLDLAWGHKKPTGVAVLDHTGRLVHVSAQQDNASILGALSDYAQVQCMVAIDAPLIVVNATGSRPAEKALNSDFARFQAGAHPANTGRPEFATTPRGAQICRDLDLDIDPESQADRRAIEVYTHPATVVLFELSCTLKYKQRSGRTFTDLSAALQQLMQLVESLHTADPPLVVRDEPQWRGLVASVQAAQRKSDLRRVEDQVDAVLCAYIARLAVAHPDRMTTYGDLATGYIVTPALPAPGHPRPDSDLIARAAAREYERRRPEVLAATQRYITRVTGLLDDAGINYLSVTGRTKSLASFAVKAHRRAAGRAVFTDPLREITDQIGIRVITFVASDVAAVADLLAAQLAVLDDRDMGEETAAQGRFGYSSRHVLVRTADGDDEADPELRGYQASVQVRTVLQHAWAEFEHDIRYKGTIPAEYAPDLDRRFTLAAGLLELADREFSTIRDRLQESMSDQRAEPDGVDPRISAQDLASFLAGRFAEAGWSRAEHYGWISGLLLELGVSSLDELGAQLAVVDASAVNEAMDYRYPPGAVRRLDDALLHVYGEQYVDLSGNAARREGLRSRLRRMRMRP